MTKVILIFAAIVIGVIVPALKISGRESRREEREIGGLNNDQENRNL